jgi:flagellar biosynthetic protein FliR
VGALIMTAPIFGTKAAPVQFRAFLAVALTLIISPLQSVAAHVDPTQLVMFAKYLASEALVGLLMGLGLLVLLSGVQLTGQIISQMGGMALADAVDPNLDESVPFFSQLLYFLTLTMFVLLDGHRMLIGALLDTYQWLPVGGAQHGDSYVEALTTLLGQSFMLGVRAAAPAMTALLLSTLMLGLIGRTMPQINILAVGFGVNALLTLGCLFVSLGAVAWAFPQQAVLAIDLLKSAIRDATTWTAPTTLPPPT